MEIRNVKNEQQKKYNYVYKLTFKYDKRYFYIGKRSTNKEDDSEYLGSGKALKSYKEKYGKYCFDKEILSFWPTAEEALIEESKIVTKELIKNEYCLNRMVGGGNFDTTGCIRGKASIEEIRKNSESHKGLKQSEETKKKRSKAIREKWQNEEYRNAQKEGRKGKYDKHLEKLSEERQNKICIIKNERWKYINKEELFSYKEQGWETRGIENKPSYDEILKYREDGLTYSKIGEIYGVNESAVRNWKRRYEKKNKK